MTTDDEAIQKARERVVDAQRWNGDFDAALDAYGELMKAAGAVEALDPGYAPMSDDHAVQLSMAQARFEELKDKLQ